MPGAGVHVTTITRSGPTGSSVPLEGQAFVAASTLRGPAGVPTLVQNWAEFVATFGAPSVVSSPEMLYADVVRSYFEEGGQRLWVSRVLGAGGGTPTKATLSLLDRAGTPLPTLTLTATEFGAFANSITVAVANGSGTNVVLTFAGLPDSPAEVVLPVAGTPAALVTAINGHARLSRFLLAANAGSATASPNNRPAVVAATHLASGSAGTADGTEGFAGHLSFPVDLGPGLVMAINPGEITAEDFTAALEAAEPDVVALGRPLLLGVAGATLTEEQLISLADGIRAEAAQLDGDVVRNVGLVGQEIVVPGGRTTAAIGYLAAGRARTIALEGAWRAAAGEPTVARWILGPASQFTSTAIDRLTDAGVIPLRVIGGVTRVYGWRSLSSDLENFALLSASDLLQVISWRCSAALEALVFSTIDSAQRLLSRMEASLVGVVEPIRVAGGLFEKLGPDGSRIDPGYTVDVGSIVNPIEQLAANQLAGIVAARPSPTAELVELTIIRAALTASL